MHVGLLIIGIISSFFWRKKCTDAIPTVTLTSVSSPYFDIGGSLSLTCAINETEGIKNVYLRRERDGLASSAYVWIIMSSCVLYKQTSKDPHTYNITCEQQMTVHIIMNGTDADDHNATWSCQMTAESGICSPLCTSTSSVRTAQRVPVSSLQLTDGTGQALVTPVSVLDGSNKDFRCDTSPNGSRPRALFNWYKRSENQTLILIQDQSVSTAGPKPEVELSINISYSTLTLMGNRSYQNMYIYCEARDETNRGNFSRSREVQLNIVYGPGRSSSFTPNISVYEVEEGQKAVDIVCRATCNPTCSYRWLKGSVQINSSNTLSLGIVQKHMTGNYICEAFNTIQGQRRGSNISMEVIVKYAPIVKLQATVRDVNPYRVKQGRENVVLVCEVLDAYPQPTLFVWTHNGNEIQSESRSTITIPVAIRQTDGTWGCKGLNGYGTPLESKLQVDVQYGPVLEPIENKTVIEGQMFSVTCNIDSNPLPAFISWTKDHNATFSHNSAVLTIVSLSRYDSGTYRCRAVNIIHPSGQNEESLNGMEWFYLNVQYAAKITEFVAKSNASEILENSLLPLYCRVDSNPYSVISLFLNDVLMSRIQDAHELIHNVTAECFNVGKYICSATNSVMNGVTVFAEFDLKVQCGPRLDYRKNISTVYYRSLNDNVTLEVNVIAYPEPTNIMWYHRGSNTDKWQQARNQPISSSGLFSTITVHLGSPADFGDYLVNMTNSFGIYDLIFQVIQQNTMDNRNEITLIISSALFGLAACLFIAALVLFIRSRKGICIGCKNNSSNTDPKVNDIRLCQPRDNDGVSNFQADTGRDYQYEELNTTTSSTNEYEELSKGSEIHSKSGKHLYSNMINTSTL